jgi:hypothetical protein
MTLSILASALQCQNFLLSLQVNQRAQAGFRAAMPKLSPQPAG